MNLTLDVGMLSLLAVGAFAVINGRNDGATLVAAGLASSRLRPRVATVLVGSAVALVPVVLGTRVATTLSESLVDLRSGPGPKLLIGILAATFITVAIPSRWGLPTSVTLALVGATVGAGLGAHLPVAWGWVSVVAALAVAAPLLAAMAAFGTSRMLRLVPAMRSAARGLGGLQIAGFLLLCLAYGANDGQKTLAVLAVAGGVSASRAGVEPIVVLGIGLAFTAGIGLGLRKATGTVGRGLIRQRPLQVLIAETASGAAVLGGAMAGAPMSMTQSIVGAIVGASLDSGWRRVRWSVAGRLGLSWLLTLPVAMGLAMGITVLMGAS